MKVIYKLGYFDKIKADHVVVVCEKMERLFAKMLDIYCNSNFVFEFAETVETEDL